MCHPEEARRRILAHERGGCGSFDFAQDDTLRYAKRVRGRPGDGGRRAASADHHPQADQRQDRGPQSGPGLAIQQTKGDKQRHETDAVRQR
jgi:hypothetical protein